VWDNGGALHSIGTVELLHALGLEGSVTVFKPAGKRFYQVYFRLSGGRQVNLSTGCEDLTTAKIRGAEIFAQEVRRPKETAENTALQALAEEIRSMRAELNRIKGASGPVSAKPQARKTLRVGYEECVEAKKKSCSFHHADSVRIRGNRFVTYCESLGLKWFDEPDDNLCARWLESCKVELKTQHNYHGDVSCLFSWGMESPRKWRSDNPFEKIKLPRIPNDKIPEGLNAKESEAFLHGVEESNPEFISFYCLCLLCGVRQDKRDSEMTRFVARVEAEGWRSSVVDGHLVIAEPKSGPPRRILLPPNVLAWLEAYPTIRVPSQYRHGLIIKKYNLPYNALRHTGMTAFVKIGGSIADAATGFGTSEATAKRHYLTSLTKEEALEIHAILPRRKAVPTVDPPQTQPQQAA